MGKLAQFDDIWMAAFREKSEISDEAALSALRAELLEIGVRYRRIIETTPCDLKGSPFNRTLTQRTGRDEQLVRLIQMCVQDPDWHL